MSFTLLLGPWSIVNTPSSNDAISVLLKFPDPFLITIRCRPSRRAPHPKSSTVNLTQGLDQRQEIDVDEILDVHVTHVVFGKRLPFDFDRNLESSAIVNLPFKSRVNVLLECPQSALFKQSHLTVRLSQNNVAKNPVVPILFNFPWISSLTYLHVS